MATRTLIAAPGGGRQRGFILAATLWLLAILTLAAGFFSLWTQRAVDLAVENREDIQARIEMHDSFSGLLYLLASQRMTLAGLTLPDDPRIVPEISMQEITMNLLEGNHVLPVGGELPLDNRAVPGYGGARFALQDEGGLINPNHASEMLLERLLGLLGVPGEERSPLVAKLQDYIDLDDLHRINGAEAYQYRRAGLPPPTNRYLRAPGEARRVLGWAEQTGLWQNSRWREFTTVATGGIPNINTAPALVLQTLPGVDAPTAERIIQAREIQPLSSIAMLEAVTGQPVLLDPLGLRFMATDYLRVTLWHRDSGEMRQYHLRLTAFADQARPWKILYYLSHPLTDDYRNAPLHAPLDFFTATLPATS